MPIRGRCAPLVLPGPSNNSAEDFRKCRLCDVRRPAQGRTTARPAVRSRRMRPGRRGPLPPCSRAAKRRHRCMGPSDTAQRDLGRRPPVPPLHVAGWRQAVRARSDSVANHDRTSRSDPVETLHPGSRRLSNRRDSTRCMPRRPQLSTISRRRSASRTEQKPPAPRLSRQDPLTGRVSVLRAARDGLTALQWDRCSLSVAA